MDNIITVQPKEKKKGFSNENLYINKNLISQETVFERITDAKKKNEKNSLVLNNYCESYSNYFKTKNKNDFVLNDVELLEFQQLDLKKTERYLDYRYKYKNFPNKNKIEDYPPCVQIEPTSVCNYRCVMCYQIDKSFSRKSHGFMGNMSLELFKDIIDEIEGNIEAVTLASRGEPLLNPKINEMLQHCGDKFLALKLNTNASMLNEEKIHSILSSGLNTIVFSIDAADKKNYEKIRVNGNFEKVLENIENFYLIKKKHYSKNKIITRISGVKINEEQGIDDMKKQWKKYADVVAFTNYTPWQSSYENDENDITTPCSELWRRFFVWWDGKMNPCDFDYKSLLSLGTYSKNNLNIKKVWKSDSYTKLREAHVNKNRKNYEPCTRCIMT